MSHMREQAGEAVTSGRPIIVRRVDAIPVGIPFLKPMRMAHITLTKADSLLVRVEAQDGAIGWGEASAAPTLTGETLPGMVACVRDHLAPRVLGQDARRRPSLVRSLGRAVYGNTGARSAVEMALADLVGRAVGVPLVDIMGGRFRDAIEPMWLLGNGTPEEDVDEATRKRDAGYAFFKLKVGTKAVDREIETARAVRNAVGATVKICADANSGFTPATARRFLAGTEQVGLLFLEQPLPWDDLAGLARLAGTTSVPICSDQGVHSLHDIAEHAVAGVGGVSLKLIKLGGLDVTLQAARLCETRRLDLNIAAKVAESSIASAAMAHVACAVPSNGWGVSLTHVYLAEDLVTDKPALRDGKVTLPAEPGLGVTVDEAAVERLRVRALH